MALRSNRSAVCLTVESLESRLVPSISSISSTPLAPQALHKPAAPQVKVDYGPQISPSPSQTATPTVTPSASATPAKANFSYDWNVGPKTLFQGTSSITGNGRSTGSVVFATARPGNGSDVIDGSASKIDFGYIMVTSSATASRPDSYNTSFSIQLRVRDAASGQQGVLTFKGTIKGTVSWNRSALDIRLENPTQSITLGGRVYKVTLPSNLPETGPEDRPVWISASVQVSNRR